MFFPSYDSVLGNRLPIQVQEESPYASEVFFNGRRGSFRPNKGGRKGGDLFVGKIVLFHGGSPCDKA